MGVAMDTGSRRGSRQKPVDAELNLIPFIDLLVCCICFLLITAVWVQLARIDVSRRNQGSSLGEPPSPPPVSVLVGDEGYTLVVGAERLVIPRRGETYDTRTLQRRLIEARARVPGSTPLTVAAEDPIKYRQLVRTMDIALVARFARIQVSDAQRRL